MEVQQHVLAAQQQAQHPAQARRRAPGLGHQRAQPRSFLVCGSAPEHGHRNQGHGRRPLLAQPRLDAPHAHRRAAHGVAAAPAGGSIQEEEPPPLVERLEPLARRRQALPRRHHVQQQQVRERTTRHHIDDFLACGRWHAGDRRTRQQPHDPAPKAIVESLYGGCQSHGLTLVTDLGTGLPRSTTLRQHRGAGPGCRRISRPWWRASRLACAGSSAAGKTAGGA